MAPKSNKGLIVWQSVMAGFSSLCAAGVLQDWVTPKGSALLLAISSALNVGTALYVSAAKPVQTLQAPPTQSG